MANNTLVLLLNVTNPTISWTFVPILGVIVLPLTVLFNGLILILFTIDSNLRTPFNVYLANLLFANILYAVPVIPLDILNSLFRRWDLGSAACDVYIYSSYLMATVTAHCHLLITLNRLWAVQWPLSYAQRHSTKLAVGICAGMWLYVNAGLLPGIVLYFMKYQKPVNSFGCDLLLAGDALAGFRYFNQLYLFDLVNLVIPAVYPYLWYRRRKIHPVEGVRYAVTSENQPSNEAGTGATRKSKGHDGRYAVASENQPSETGGARKVKGHGRAFAVLTILTASITVCWTPAAVFFTVSMFTDVSSWPTVIYIVRGLFAVQPVLDPILFAMTLPDLRNALQSRLFCRNFFIMANISSITNATLPSITWSSIPILDVIILPLTVLFNGVILLLFLIDSNLRSPFTVYLANLLFSNVLYAVLVTPLDILLSLFPRWIFGSGACRLYIYSSYLMATVTAHCHLLITLNRLWAVQWPLSYAHRHSTKIAVGICAGMWVYVNVGLLPGIITYIVKYQKPVEVYGCSILLADEALLGFRYFNQLYLFDLVNVFIPAVYPYLWYRRRKIHPGESGVSSDKPSVEVSTGASRRRMKGQARAFAVLTMLTASITICWTPAATLFTLSMFMDVSGWGLAFQVVRGLFAVQPVLDPILFTLTLPDLRRALEMRLPWRAW
ncbi:probable G-protein coupled receptor No18 [Paramacrobiotus metropolitanus]|uniref:probable G-protein coupled receptor No18 n=1 Tax=Paramacrobiotus metropolitanus TaxID=2943436 RepID=UPI00244588FE|nr:probable G-protein coupled receptor No18 [Paramacrobiotus metropolitanus]